MKYFLSRYMPSALRFFLLSIGILAFAGCGGTAQPELPLPESEEAWYSVTYYEIPDPEDVFYESALRAEHPASYYQRSGGFLYQNGCICQRFFLMDEAGNFSDDCIALFRKDTGKWEYFSLWRIPWSGIKHFGVGQAVGISEDGVLLRLLSSDEEEGAYLGYFDGKEGQLLIPWPENVEAEAVYRDAEERYYFVSSQFADNTVYLCDKDGSLLEKIAPDGFSLQGAVPNPATGKLLWWGGNTQSTRFWDAPESYSAMDLTTGQAVDDLLAYQCKAVIAPDGVLYYADSSSLWKMGDEPTQILSFAETGYKPQTLYDIAIAQNGDILCYVLLDGAPGLLVLHREEGAARPPQQEIVLYTPQSDIILEQMITRFNRQNSEYHVVIATAETAPRAEIELSTGQGPDLFRLSPLTAADYIEQGYFQDMNNCIENPDQFLDAAMESGRVDGVTYGIPYSCSLYFPAFSGKIAGDRTSWTVTEMMQCVRASDARVLDWYYQQNNGFSIVLRYGLYDNKNKDYIDWENRQSHLTEQPFLDLLEFAAEYADTGDYDASEVLDMMQNGEIAGGMIHLFNLGSLDYAETCFAGDASYIGYPTSDGTKGVYTLASCLYLNQASDNREGVLAFIRFLLSEDAQRLCIADQFCYSLPVRLDTFSYLVAQEQKKLSDPVKPGLQTNEGTVIFWEENGLDEAQEAILSTLLHDAKPDTRYITQVENILYEELAPYFAGRRSAEEAARILDNRIQLYLDEEQ